MATAGIAQQGLSAAIVIQAVNLISDFALEADERMNRALNENIYNHIAGMPGTPRSAAVRRADSVKAVDTAMAGAKKLVSDARSGEQKAALPPMVESAVKEFFGDYLTFVDQNFPGLRAAAGAADTLSNRAFGTMGLTTTEVVDAVPADATFAWDRQDALAQERALIDASAATGHRFLPGSAFNAITRLHAASIRPAAAAAAQAHAARAAIERKARIDMARATTAQQVDRLRKITQQAAQAFQAKIRARSLHVAERAETAGVAASAFNLEVDYEARLSELMLEMAERRHANIVAAGKASDRDVQIAKANYGNGQELVDLLGNMVTTLFNQVRASGSYTGSERDITDWDSVLG